MKNIAGMIAGQDYLFNLAGQVSHLESMQSPKHDLDINAAVQFSILKACGLHNPSIKVVFAGTRQVYGKPRYLPVDENHPINPIDYNGVSKYAGEMYHLIAHRIYGLHATSLRITNTYGPRMHCKDNRKTFLGDWIRRLFLGQPIEIFGTGSQIRDLNYIDDVVNALLLAVINGPSAGEIYNLGSSETISLIDLALLMIDLFGSGSYQIHPFPPERLGIDIGDYQGNFTKIKGSLGWQPTIFLRDGLIRTFEYFRKYQEHYW